MKTTTVDEIRIFLESHPPDAPEQESENIVDVLIQTMEGQALVAAAVQSTREYRSPELAVVALLSLAWDLGRQFEAADGVPELVPAGPVN